MDNVIRPSFATRHKQAPLTTKALVSSDRERVLLRIYGVAAGHVVALCLCCVDP